MIRKIGITGGMASGKSFIAGILATALDCVRIDADEICRQLLEPRAAGWYKLSDMLGGKYFTPSGRVDRQRLRQDLFADKQLRRRVNSCIHPLAQQEISDQMDRIISFDNRARVLVEVPLLFESGWEILFDTIIVVNADDETCIARLMKRDGLDRETAVIELSSQMPLAEKVKRSDHVIDNSGTVEAATKQVYRLAEFLRSSNGGDKPS